MYIYGYHIMDYFENLTENVTGPAKTGHICTQILQHFSHLKLMLLYTW